MSEEKQESLNFLEIEIQEDIKNKVFPKEIHTRFPPEPNGHLHLGHATAICFNFDVAKKYGGKTNLRFDDTNPTTESTEYVNAIKRDISWLGYEWDGEAKYASDYFDQLYAFALKLIKKGLAYVDDSSAEKIAEEKGTPASPGIESQYRTRTIEENLDLFERMKAGEFEDGARVLRAKVDMTSPNMHLRDPVIYRIKHEHHHRTGDTWCIYPMYDFAHGQSDSIEEITHSMCSLEFIHHRPLYNWFIEHLEIFPSRQIEFARRNVAYMITSKRKLLKLVEDGLVSGWDDPRMPTLSGMRRRGYPAKAIRDLCDKMGMSKRDNVAEFGMLESCVRDELNAQALRRMVVINPIKLTITNYPEGQVEMMKAENKPKEEDNTREIPFSRELYIERDDFMIDAPKKYFRLSVGKTVRLKNGYIITGDSYVLDENGEVEEVLCTYYPESRSGSDTSGIKAKGVMHWVSREHAVSIQINNYDLLFTDPTPTSHEDKDYLEFFNKDSLKIHHLAVAEPEIKNAKLGEHFQFMRKGYYYKDQDSTDELIIFNSTVGLKDNWKKIQQKQNKNNQK